MRALSRALRARSNSFVRDALSALLLTAPITVARGTAQTSGFDSTGTRRSANNKGSSGTSSRGFGSGSSSGDNGTSTGVEDLSTCTAATSSHAYIGCDYWPTSVANNVWSIFDFAVVVSNPQTSPVPMSL